MNPAGNTHRRTHLTPNTTHSLGANAIRSGVKTKGIMVGSATICC